MRKYLLLYVSTILIILFTVSCSNIFVYRSVKSSDKCVDKGGYWYHDKCWKEFDDDGIAKSDIDSVVTAQMKIINKTTIVVGNDTLPLLSFFPLDEGKDLILIAVYGKDSNIHSFIFPTTRKKVQKENAEIKALLFNGNAISGTMDKKVKLKGFSTVTIKNLDSLIFVFNGKLYNKDSSIVVPFRFTTNSAISGTGNSKLDIEGDKAYLSGDLGTITYHQIRDMINNYPQVKTIVMTHISGSVNDAVNMHTGRLIREHNLNTKVLSNSDIASGGVDLFCAGKERIVEKGAKIGVHSWCCVNNKTASEIPKDHPAHQYQLAYFTMTLGKDKGPAFYFYTLNAAPFDGIHYMTDEEIKKWNIATNFIEP